MGKNREPKNVIGGKLREMRTGKGVTQVQLSRQLNARGVSLTNSALSKVETGDRSVSDYELLGIAQCLGISVGSMFGEDLDTVTLLT